MASVIKKTAPFTYIASVNTPDYPARDWLINPDLSAVAGLPQSEWKVEAGAVVPKVEADKLPDLKAARKAAIDARSLAIAEAAALASGDGLKASIDSARTEAEIAAIVDSR